MSNTSETIKVPVSIPWYMQVESRLDKSRMVFMASAAGMRWEMPIEELHERIAGSGVLDTAPLRMQIVIAHGKLMSTPNGMQN